YDRFNRWRKDGTWAQILDALLLQLDRAGRIDRDLWCIDATVNRAHVAAAGAEKKSRRVAAARRAAGAAPGRAGRPRAEPLPRRLRDQAAPALGQPRHRPGRGGDPRPAARNPGGPGGYDPVQTAAPGGPAALAGQGCRRQGVQLPGGAGLAVAAAHRAGDPDAQGPAARPGLRQGDLPPPEHHRAGGRLVQVVPGAGDALRQAGGELRRPLHHREYTIPPPPLPDSAGSPIVRNDLGTIGSSRDPERIPGWAEEASM